MAAIFLSYSREDHAFAETLSAPQLSGGLKIMAVYLLFSAMSGYQTGALAGLEGYPLHFSMEPED